MRKHIVLWGGGVSSIFEKTKVDLRLCIPASVPLQDFEFQDWDELCDKLNTLATDCNKHRAKTDKKKQRSVFRDVLKAVEVSARQRHRRLSFSSAAKLRLISNPPPRFPAGG